MIVETATELQARARAYVDDVLIPCEVAAERAGGRLPASEIEIIRREALERGLAGGRHAVEHGGQGWSTLEWFLVEEQLGRSTNALSWHVPNAYNVLAHGTPEQIDRYLRPALRGELAGRLRGHGGARRLRPVRQSARPRRARPPAGASTARSGS
jgi:acyl-CoA dehydrogenase